MDLLTLCKQCLSVNSSSTIKDDEINLTIEAAKNDLIRQGINVYKNNSLVRQAIVMYVKANFGNVDIKEKELSAKRYNLLCNNLSLSESYKEVNSNGCTRNLPN